MRVLSVILNIGLLVSALIIVAEEGWPQELMFRVMVVVFFAAPISSVLALWSSSRSEEEGWLTLYLRRKRLEEIARIKELGE